MTVSKKPELVVIANPERAWVIDRVAHTNLCACRGAMTCKAAR